MHRAVIQYIVHTYLHSSFFSKAHDVEKGGQKSLHSAKISTSKELGTNTCTVMGLHQNKYKHLAIDLTLQYNYGC